MLFCSLLLSLSFALFCYDGREHRNDVREHLNVVRERLYDVASPSLAGTWAGRYGIASIAQLAEHVPRKHKVTSSILVGGFPVGPLV